MALDLDINTEAVGREVIGAAIAVHCALGPGFLESTYERALCIELTKRGIPYTAQHLIRVEYEGIAVGEGRVDLLVNDALIVEVKAVEQLAPIHEAQIMSYLRATRIQLGLLINFNTKLLKQGIRRIVLTR